MAYLNSPNKVYGVQYYNQFAKHFLKPYGEIKECIEEEQILKEIKPINCECLGRPKIALSEMGETYSKNYDKAIDLLSRWDLESMQGKLKQYSDKVKMLNTRTEPPVSRENVIDAMKFHATDDEEFLSLIDDLEVIGQSFYNTAIHFKTLRALICNPYAYAQKMNMANGEDAQFKSEASVKNLKELFIKETVTVKTPVATPHKKRIKKEYWQTCTITVIRTGIQLHRQMMKMMMIWQQLL